jgi:hypothetical protein
MLGYWNHQDEEAVRTWRVLTGWIAAFVLAIALIVPVPAPAGTTRHEDARPISESFAAAEQDPADLSSHALVCHMHFEHHQLVRSENVFVIPTLDSVRACELTPVKSLASLEPAPLYRPPRA